MVRLQKILMIASLVFTLVCLGATVWAAVVTGDPSFYLYAVLFVFAAVWFGITVYKSYRKGK